MASSQGSLGTGLVNGLKEFYPSGEFSDLTLVCDGREFKVHKIILCTQSDVFRKMLRGKFKEATTGQNKIELDDDPPIMEVMLRYFYHFTYDDSSRMKALASPFHVRVYAIADKYNVPTLRKMASLKFAKTCDPATNFDDFLAAIRAVDEHTSDRILWDAVVPKIRDNIGSLLASNQFRELLQELPALNYRLLSLLDPNGAGQADATSWYQPSAPSVAVDGDEDEDDDDSVPIPYGSSMGRTFSGQGRRLG